jgi:DNA-binding CsgD family transcriptional regulator
MRLPRGGQRARQYNHRRLQTCSTQPTDLDDLSRSLDNTVYCDQTPARRTVVTTVTQPSHREFAAQPHQQASPAPERLRPSLATLVDSCQLPSLLVGLPFGEILAANEAASALLTPDTNRESWSPLVGRRLGEVLGDPSRIEAMLAMLATGQLESFCRRQMRPGRTVARASAQVTVTAHPSPAEDLPHHAVVVVQHSPDHVDKRAALGGTRGESGQFIGIVNREWRLTELTAGARALLGDELLDDDRAITAHVHPGDLAKLLMAVATLATGQRQSSLVARLRAADGGWMTCHVVVAALDNHPPPAFAFLASPAHSESTDTAAAGLQLSRLTTRERQVVSMLISGEDVSRIAAELFISPSTVRNHLAASFRKLGVRSQRELLRRVRERHVAYP